MLYIVLGMLNELRPVWYYVIAAVLFVLSQLDYFLLSKVICNVRATWVLISVHVLTRCAGLELEDRWLVRGHRTGVSGRRCDLSRVEKHHRRSVPTILPSLRLLNATYT